MGVSFLSTPPVHDFATFSWMGAHQKQVPVHEIAQFHGQNDLSTPDTRPVSEGSQIIKKKPL